MDENSAQRGSARVREPRQSMVVGSADDLLAAVPVALGFVPSNSVVMVALGAGVGPHARVDLSGPGQHEPMARCLVQPAVRHGVERVALIIYAEHSRAEAPAGALGTAFADAGIEVAALLSADGDTWLSWSETSRTVLPREYDSLSHRFVADAVLAGQVVLGSRAELVARLAPDPAQVARCERVPEAVPALDAPGVTRLLRDAVQAHAVLSDAEVSSLRRAIRSADARDACWSWVERADVQPHLDLWTRVVRSCARGEASAEASVLGFLAWLAGEGALAWCALDRAGEAGDSTSLARLVADLLERAVPPRSWSPPSAATDASVPEGRVIGLEERRRRRAGR